jgi:hypothetical protein
VGRRGLTPRPDLGLDGSHYSETGAPEHALTSSRPTSRPLAQAISDRQPGAATMSPARNTPSPRSMAGRSRHVCPGRSSAPLRPLSTCRREALDPAVLREVDDDERIASPVAERDVEADGAAAQPLKRGVAGQLTRLIELDGQDDRRLGQIGHPLARADGHAEGARPCLHRVDDRVPAADWVAGHGLAQLKKSRSTGALRPRAHLRTGSSWSCSSRPTHSPRSLPPAGSGSRLPSPAPVSCSASARSRSGRSRWGCASWRS